MKSDLARDDIFIAQMLEETYQELSSDESVHQIANLNDYFERTQEEYKSNLDPTLENFLSRQAGSIFNLNYNPKTGCYRLNFQNMELDLPSNWGVLEMFGRETTFVDLTNGELAPILCTKEYSTARPVLIGAFAHLQLVLFNEKDEFSLRWLEKYFSHAQKKAA